MLCSMDSNLSFGRKCDWMAVTSLWDRASYSNLQFRMSVTPCLSKASAIVDGGDTLWVKAPELADGPLY